jgi:anti-anti-sigma factor
LEAPSDEVFVAQLKVQDRGNGRWLLLEGELDQTDVLDLKETFDAAVSGTKGDIVVDLGGVTFFGTLGIGLIVSTQDSLGEEGRTLRLANVPDFIDRTLRTMNMDDMFERV